MAVVVVVLVLFFSAGAYNARKSNLASTHKCCKIPSVYCTCKCSSFEGAPVQAERCAAALATLRAHLLAGRPLEHHQARWLLHDHTSTGRLFHQTILGDGFRPCRGALFCQTVGQLLPGAEQRDLRSESILAPQQPFGLVELH